MRLARSRGAGRPGRCRLQLLPRLRRPPPSTSSTLSFPIRDSHPSSQSPRQIPVLPSSPGGTDWPLASGLVCSRSFFLPGSRFPGFCPCPVPRTPPPEPAAAVQRESRSLPHQRHACRLILPDRCSLQPTALREAPRKGQRWSRRWGTGLINEIVLQDLCNGLLGDKDWKGSMNTVRTVKGIKNVF